MIKNEQTDVNVDRKMIVSGKRTGAPNNAFALSKVSSFQLRMCANSFISRAFRSTINILFLKEFTSKTVLKEAIYRSARPLAFSLINFSCQF